MFNEPFLEPVFRFYRIQKVAGYIEKGTILCDIGCGRKAIFLKRMRKKIKFGIGYDREAMNSSFANIYLCKSHIGDDLPLKNESIDVITMLAVLEHFYDPDPLLKECYRVLKTGGHLIFTTPAPPAKRIIEFLGYKLRLVDRNLVAEHNYYYRPDEIIFSLTTAGFKEKMISVKRFQFGLNIFCRAKK